MAKYTWESIRKDATKRKELYAAIEALSQGLDKMDLSKIEGTNAYLIARERAPRVREILQRMQELPNEGEKNPDFEDCMANISDMLSKMEKRQPEEYQTLTGIEGFQDLRESCDSMMPAKNTVGAVALDERTFIHGDEPKETISTFGARTLAGFLAMNELTEGVEDWRSVRVSEEEYYAKREDYYELLSIYGTTYFLTDDKKFMKSLSAPGKVTSVAQKGYQLFYDSFQNARKEYPEQYRSDVQDDDKTIKKMAFSHFMTLRALEGEVKPDGSIKAVKDSMLKYEAAFDEIGMDFMASMPPEELDALLARDSSDKAVENAVRKFVANLDKIPEGLPNGVQPSIKERIQALQQKPEAEKKKALESGDAFNQIGLAFIASMPPEKLNRLLAGSSSDETVENEVRKFVANLDKIPEGLPEGVQPSAKERIEALQQKLKAEKDMATKMRLTAEIIATREMAGAQRGGKGLENRPDPVAVAARTVELAAEMSKVRESDPKAMDKVVAQATSGHGGKMMEAYNKAEKPVSYLDYINKLNLENPTSQDVAKLVAATGLLIVQEEGAQAIANPKQIDKIAAAIDNEPAFQNMMKDQQVIQNAKMGLGLPLMEQLNAKKKAMEKKPGETEKKTGETEKKTGETEKKTDGPMRTF